MNITLSWKISSGMYAYVYIPNSETRISKKISSDSPQWESIIEIVSQWTKDDYIRNFKLMAEEVKRRFGISMTFQESYWGVTGDTINSKNIIILSSDGGGSGSGGSGGTGSGGGSGAGGTVGTNDIDVSVYDKFNEMIDSKLNEAREDLNKQNEAVQKFVEDKVTETIAEARETIAETKKELGDVREELTNQLEGATETLNKAASLFEFGEQNITAESIIGVFNSVDEFGGWLSGYSGSVMDIKADYDLATERMGTIGTAEDATLGLFSRVATSLSNISGTVGTVQETMDASTGTIEQLATWYDNNVSSVTEATRMIVASASLISDSVEFINGDGLTSKIVREIDGAKAQIKDEILVETEEIVSNVESTMNAMSGFIMNKITMVDNKTSALTQMEDKMDALAGTMERYMTITEETNGLTYDLRDEWSKQSGKVSTVASLTAELDENGEVMYFASGSSVGEERVFKNSDDEWVGEKSGRKFGEEEVYFHIADTMMSYIQQTTSAITLSVVGSEEVTAGLKLGLKEDGSFINLIADEVVIDADVIAKAISAKTANIGGIMIGNGIVESMKTIGTGVFNSFSSSITESIVEFPLKTLEDNLWKFYDECRFDEQFVYSVENEENIQHYYSAWTNSSKEEKLIFNVIKHMDGSWYSNESLDEEMEHLIYEKNNISYISGITQEKRIYTVILSGDTWVDLNGTTYDESLIYEQEAQIPAFKLDGIQGKLISHNAEIYGDIHADSGNIGKLKLKDGAIENKNFSLSSSGLVINGSIRQPFMRLEPVLSREDYEDGGIEWFSIDDETEIELNSNAFSNQKYYDNLYIPEPIEYRDGNKLTYLPSSISDIGRRILLVHNKNGKQVNELSASKLYLQDGYYFFEDGFASNSLTFSNEMIELVGYGINDKGQTLVNGDNGESVFYGWIVLNRKNIMTKASYGHELRALAMGYMRVASYAYISDFQTFDKTKLTSKGNVPEDMWTNDYRTYFSISGDSTAKKVKVMLPSRWFNGGEMSNMMIQVTPRSLCTVCAKPTPYGFEVETSVANVDVDFIIYNKNDWYSLPTYVDFSFSVSKQNHNFSYYHATASYADTIYLYPTPSNTTINVNWSGDISKFTYKYDTANKKLVVYPNSWNRDDTKTLKLTATITATYGSETKTVNVKYTQSNYPYNTTPT